MEGNPVTCGNCQTENPPGQDFCVNCGQPLTGSAEQGVRESIAADLGGGSFIGNENIAGRNPIAPGLAGGAGGVPTHLAPGDPDLGSDARDRT